MRSREEKNQYAKDWYHKNRKHILAKAKVDHAKNRLIRNARHRIQQKTKKYNLTKEQYAVLIAKGCEICGTKENLCIDHDHNTGRVRGCLCRKHNSALGMLQDSIALVLKLYNYMSRK